TSYLSRGCADPLCDRSKIERTDIFCHTHQRFIPFSFLPKFVRYTVLIGWAISIALSFPLAAAFGSPLPVFAAAWSVGGAILVLPLRTYWLRAAVFAVVWLACCGALVWLSPGLTRCDHGVNLLHPLSARGVLSSCLNADVTNPRI